MAAYDILQDTSRRPDCVPDQYVPSASSYDDRYDVKESVYWQREINHLQSRLECSQEQVRRCIADPEWNKEISYFRAMLASNLSMLAEAQKKKAEAIANDK